jgi:AcrR family transcriptional regulator
MTQKQGAPIVETEPPRNAALTRARRPRNAALTREAILHSALAAFSRHGYDGIGVREIAQAAGVTAVLVNRYFGSKEKLFAAAVERAFDDRMLLDGDLETLGERMAAQVVTKNETGAEPIDPFRLLLRSAPNPRAAEILRESIARHYEQPLRDLLQGPKAGQRAAMILALIVGFALWRKILGSKALADASVASLSGELATMFQRLIDSSAGGESGRGKGGVRKRDQ